MNENVKRIKGFENYTIDINGNVVNTETGYKLKPCVGKIGYFTVGLQNKKKKKRFYIHRLIAENFISNPENKCCVNHINGIKTDNRVENLEWVTTSENIRHAYRTGLRSSQRNLTDKEYKDLLFNRFFKGETLTSIANDENINIKVSTLSIHFKRIVKELSILDKYMEELKKQQIKAAKKKGIKVRQNRHIEVYKNNEYLGTYNNLTEIANKFNLRSGCVANVLAGRSKTTLGYTFIEKEKIK